MQVAAEMSTTTTQKQPQKQSGCEIVSNYNWDYRTAYAICMAESGGNPRAFNGKNRNGSTDKGILQINSIHVRSGLIGDDERYDPVKNVEAGYRIYLGSGFHAWSSYNSGAYLKYLN